MRPLALWSARSTRLIQVMKSRIRQTTRYSVVLRKSVAYNNMVCVMVVKKMGYPGLRIHIHLITDPDPDQHFRLNRYRSGSRYNPDPDPEVLMTKNFKKCTTEKKDVQVTTEAFTSQKGTSSTSKHEISELFSTSVGHFCPTGSGSGSTDSIESGSNLDPDPHPWGYLTHDISYLLRQLKTRKNLHA